MKLFEVRIISKMNEQVTRIITVKANSEKDVKTRVELKYDDWKIDTITIK